MWQINNKNHVKFVHSEVCTFYTQISCIENTFDTWINVFIDEIRTYEWTNVTWISHLLINSCVKYVFNAWYQCMKHTNFAWFPLLSHEMLSLWCKNSYSRKTKLLFWECKALWDFPLSLLLLNCFWWENASIDMNCDGKKV